MMESRALRRARPRINSNADRRGTPRLADHDRQERDRCHEREKVIAMLKTTLVYPVSIIILIIAAAGIAGCSNATIANPGVAGTYVNEDNEGEFLELNTDGTFYLKEASSYSNYGIHGKWEMKANVLRLHSDMMGMTMEMEKQGNTLYSYDNRGRVSDRYTKQ
jgi:hypothetical protein